MATAIARLPVSPGLSPKTRPNRPHSYREAAQFQAIAMKAVEVVGQDAVNPLLKPDERARAATALAMLQGAWGRAEHHKRVMRGLGNPKSVEARNAKPKVKPKKSESATIEDQPEGIS